MSKKNTDYRKEKLYQKGVTETIRAIIKHLDREAKVTEKEMKSHIKSGNLDEAFRYQVENETYDFLADILEHGEMDALDEILSYMES